MKRKMLTVALLTVAPLFVTYPGQADESAPIGKPVRDFRLPDVLTGKDVRLSESTGKVVVLIFYSHTCTFCNNYEARFRQLAADHHGKGVAFFAIDSTTRSATEVGAAWKGKRMGFPLLQDTSARTAASLGATAMTTVCIVDARGNLRYIGAFDDSESGKEIRCRFVADAVAALLAGKRMVHEQTEVYGCLIPLPK